ncbi:MAG TPA: DUF4156 domain-containing protein [Gammaproteobacteria bacterium]
MFRPTACLARICLALACLFVSACAWVTLEKGAADVLILPPDRLPAGCESRGTVKVSVLDKVGVLERHDDEVIEDLNILARNYAAERGGDTAVPRGPVTGGERQYEIFRCTETTAPDDADAAEPADDDVEVIPYRGETQDVR